MSEPPVRKGIRGAFRLALNSPERKRRQLDEEVAFHIESRVEQLMQAGMSREEARRIAEERFAGTGNSMDDAHAELHGAPTRIGRRLQRRETFADMMRDMRHACRSLRRAPLFTALSILTLALGIGASTAIFSVVRGIVLRPLPYRNPDALIHLRHKTMGTVAPAMYEDWRRESKTLQYVSAAEWWSPTVTGTDRPEEVDAIRIGGDMLPMLGVQMIAGRMFSPAEVAEPLSQVVVLGHAYWRTNFGADTAAIGRNMNLDGRPHTIIGIMPAATPFIPFWADEAALAVPLNLSSRITDRSGASLRVVGRLRPGVDVEVARAELNAISERISRELGDTDNGVDIVPLHEMAIGNVRKTLYGVFASVGCLLLIACANVAHLQLMRNSTREREFAIRAAIGGSRAHLIGQSLLESSLLITGALAAGTLLARVGLDTMVALAPSSIPRLDAVHLDGAVMLFALLQGVAALALFGVLPIALMKLERLQFRLREGGSAGESRQRARLRGILVISEFAMALVLLTTAALVVRTVRAMSNVDPGFETSNVLTMRVSLKATSDSSRERRSQWFRDAIDRVESVPGVESASMINHLPLQGDHWRFGYIVDGEQVLPSGSRPSATFRVAASTYFNTMGIQLVEGRTFNVDDMKSNARVVVINKTMAARHWSGSSALGKRITVDQPADWFTVIGVVEDVRQGSWTEDNSAEMYYPSLVSASPSNPPKLMDMLNPIYMTFVVRMLPDPNPGDAAILRAISEGNRSVAISDVTTMSNVVRDEFATSRFYMTVFGVFASIAIILALIGVYGVLSYSVARRTRELGVRLALGATRSSAWQLVMKQAALYVFIGSIAGAAVSLVVSQLVRGVLYGVEPFDPTSIAVSVGLLTVCALLGSSIPAWRAGRIDPLTAIRME